MKIFLCEAIHQNAYNELKKYGVIIDDFNRIQECEVLINRKLSKIFKQSHCIGITNRLSLK